MKKRHIFTIIFPTFLLIIFISITLITLIFSNVIYNSNISAVNDKLHSAAYSLAPFVEKKMSEKKFNKLEKFLIKLAEKTGLQISVVSSDRKILIDTEKRRKAGNQKNPHTGQKLEFIKLKDEILHFSLPLLNSNHRIGTLTVSKNINDIKHRIYASYIYIACIGIAVAGVAAVLAFFNAKSITDPLEKLKNNASFITTENSKFIPINSNIFEISELSESISAMSACLQNQIAQIMNQKNRLKIILSNMKEGIIAVDSSSNIITINSSAKKILNINIKTLTSSPFHYSDEDNAAEHLHPLSHTLENDELIQFAEKILKQKVKMQQQLTIIVNKKIRIIDVKGEILKNHSGHFVGALIVINDVTKLKLLEEMRKNFAANVSHELKTPLTAIKGAVETLLDGACNTPETNERFLKIIRKHCDRLTNLINDTMSIARLERNELNEPVENFKIRTLINHSLDLFKEKTEGDNIKIITDCSNQIEIKGNFNLLEQAMVNLIDNAIKYTPENGKILITCITKDNTVIISVTDYGPGIPAEHIPHIFERFYRVDKGRSRNEGGTGLGLAIVKHIAQVHSGTVTVKSIPNKKTVFSVHLPLS
jgi:two-component system phosphate regulon sensor histidine kinase PhoR